MTPGGWVDATYLAAYAAVVLTVGYAAVSAVSRADRRHWAELAGLSVAVGAALTASALFAASLAGWVPSRGLLGAWAAVAAAAVAGVLWRRGRLVMPTVPAPRGPIDPASVIGVLAAATLVAAAANVLVAGSRPGLANMDEYATWMFKAKVLATAPLVPVPAAFRDPGLSYSHQDYPLLLPLLVDGAYAAVGRIDERVGKAVLFPLYLALIGLVYAGVRRHHRRAIAAAVTAVAVAGPTTVLNAGLAVGELPVTLCLAGAASLLARWADDVGGEPADLWLGGGLAAAAAFAKNEGLAMLPVFAVAAAVTSLSARRRTPVRASLRSLAVAATTTAVLVGPWLAYRTRLPKTHEDYGGKFSSVAAVVHGLPRLPAVLGALLRWMADAGSAGGVWIVLAVAVAVGWRAWRWPVTRGLWIVLMGQLGLYVAAFLVTPWQLGVLMPMVASKLLAQAAPVAALLIGVHLRSALKGTVGTAGGDR